MKKREVKLMVPAVDISPVTKVIGNITRNVGNGLIMAGTKLGGNQATVDAKIAKQKEAIANMQKELAKMEANRKATLNERL